MVSKNKVKERPAKGAELTPDDIRRIREKLGISQVEAGELLGGGPRAFTKYESGTIKPAAAVANLLRMLEASPSALSTLTGKKLPPIESDGLKPFEVTGQHVSALSERKLVNLTRRLLAAEAHSGGLPMDGIHVAAVITAPDGGEDAKIEWAGGPERTNWLPARYTQIQLKVGGLSPAEAASEVVTAAADVKPMIRTAIEAGGTYILASARSYTDSLIKARESAIRKKLADAGLKFRPEQVQFRDADQLALWVNAHPPVAAWLLEQTQPGLVGVFRDWTHWDGRFDAVRWIPDTRLPVVQERLRKLITLPRGVARVIGLSGYGKSRLVHEALGPTVKEENAPRLCDLVLYAVESEVGPTAVKSVVQNLADSGIRAIVVVDRCASDVHQDLAAMVKRAGSRLSLVTIDYETSGAARMPEDTIHIERASDDVIENLLKQIAPGLPSEDQRRLVRFSQGFPQIAVLLGQSWLKDSSIASMSDSDLFDRIILGRKPSDEALLRETGMLLGAFGLVGLKAPFSDLEAIVPLSRGRSSGDLRAGLDELLQRGVVQQHGRLVSLQPKPLAMGLAERQWCQWSEAIRQEVLFGNLPTALRIRAARQLALLNDRPIALEIARYVCRLDGPLASLEALERKGTSEILAALAEIDANAAMTLLERVIGSLSVEELKEVKGDTRRQLVWALEKIAFLEATFERAALLLLSLAAAENETWGNNATGRFKCLFPVFLSDTAAGPEARLQLLDELVTQNDPSRMPIVVDALLRGADINSSHRMVGAETHGSRPAVEAWEPKLWKDAWDYVVACLNRLATLGLRNDAIGARARAGMPHTFRPMASAGLIDPIEAWIEQVTAVHTYWPEALDALSTVIQFDAGGFKGDAADRIEKLIASLQPKDLSDRVRFLVKEMPWDYPGEKNVDFSERTALQVRAVEDLIEELLKHPEELQRLLPFMSGGRQRMALTAGFAIAMKSSDPNSWAMPLCDAVAALPPDERNFGLLAGFYQGLATQNSAAVEGFKLMAVNSEVFASAFPILCSAIGISASDVKLACKALRSGTIGPIELSHWTMGGVLAKLPVSAVTPLFDELLSMDEIAYSVALDLMGMYVHGDAERLKHMRPQLLTVAKNIVKNPKSPGSHMSSHHFEQIIGWLLKKGRNDPDAAAVALELATQAAEAPDSVAELLKPVLRDLLSNFATIVWPKFGQAIVADRAKAWRLEHLLGDSYSFAETKSPPILSVPEDLLFAWCHANPEIGPAFLAQFVPILTRQRPEEGGNKLHPTAKRLLDEFGHRDDVLKRLVQNMHTFGWAGSTTAYYALYDAPLRSLENHPIGAVRRWSKTMHSHMASQIQVAQTEDDEQKAQWDL